MVVATNTPERFARGFSRPRNDLQVGHRGIPATPRCDKGPLGRIRDDLRTKTLLYGEGVKILPFGRLGGVLQTISNLVGERIGLGCLSDLLQ